MASAKAKPYFFNKHRNFLSILIVRQRKSTTRVNTVASRSVGLNGLYMSVSVVLILAADLLLPPRAACRFKEKPGTQAVVAFKSAML